jgi:hypothetical protein
VPIWYEAENRFEIPPQSLPLPRFPIEGILTRFLIKEDPNVAKPPFDIVMIETSSPGLRGQSGGPIFDTNACILGVTKRNPTLPLGV